MSIPRVHIIEKATATLQAAALPRCHVFQLNDIIVVNKQATDDDIVVEATRFTRIVTGCCMHMVACQLGSKAKQNDKSILSSPVGPYPRYNILEGAHMHHTRVRATTRISLGMRI